MSDKGNKKNDKGTRVHSKSAKHSTKTQSTAKRGPCPWLCNLVPVNVPGPAAAQMVLHPHKDVFVLKVAKVGPNGDRRCKMELELVTPQFPKKQLCRLDTRETQCDPEPPPCCCWCVETKKKKK